MKPFLALEASAGSGKTFALSVRFVALILNGAKLNEILALTFTNKAANEMKERIISLFLNLHELSKEAECAQLCKLLSKDKNELIKIRDELKNEFLQTSLKISTFDAFFARILRAFALNLGLSSDFKSSEKSADISLPFLKELDRAELESLARYIYELDKKKDFFTQLEKLYQNVYELDIKPCVFPSKDKLEARYTELRSYCLSLDGQIGKGDFKYLSANFKDEKLSLSDFLDKPVLKMPDDEDIKAYVAKLNDTNTRFMSLKMGFLEALNEYAKALEAYKINKLLSLLKAYECAKNKYFVDKNALSFSDISKKVLELMKSDFKDMIYFRLDGAISHLLIDEFQDTSVLQYEILKPIIAELVSGIGVKTYRSFFYVGDVKQSIYRFRNAKKELFHKLLSDFSQIKKASLDTNYRSKKVLVEFINDNFKGVYKDFLAQKFVKNGGFVRVLESNESEKNSENIKKATLNTLKNQLDFLFKKGVKSSEICILCWVNNDCDMTQEFLQNENIPCFTQSSIALENKAGVRLVLEYAKYCVFGDEFYGEFIKELVGFKAPRLNLDLSKSVPQTLLYLARKLKLSLADTSLLQLVEYAASKENILELLFEENPLKIELEQELGISIMSVHKSKGLEFDNVILLDSLSKPPLDSTGVMLEYDDELNLELMIREKALKISKDKAYEAFIQKLDRLDFEDKINKLYVAMTRAKSALIIIKRNALFVDKTHPSFFGGENAVLSLECVELGKIDDSPYQKQDLEKKSFAPLDKFEIIEKQELESRNYEQSEQIYFGNAFHYFMQNLNFTSPNYDITFQKTKNKFRYFLNESDFNELLKRAKNLLSNTKFKQILSAKKLHKEQMLSFKNELFALDLLALGENEAVIIDYKTGNFDENAHKAQVANYKEAVAKILNLPTKAFIVYVLQNDIKITEL